MRLLLLAALGGAVGTVARYLTVTTALQLLGPGYPWGTLSVNVVGCFLMGLIVSWIGTHMDGSADLRVLLATGFLGGFTTFSAFSLDFLQLMERKATGLALGYAGASVVLSIVAVYAGFEAARLLLG